MGNLKGNSETCKNLGVSDFEYRVSGIGWFQFSVSGSKKIVFYPGSLVWVPTTHHYPCNANTTTYWLKNHLFYFNH